MDFVIDLPKSAAGVLERLWAAGHEAYVVGGCVRDCVLGKPPGDWDVATSATPDEVAQIFNKTGVLTIGQRHGTMSVKSAGVYCEVTTFRVDGEYSDHRRPDNVDYTDNLAEDLARRDFTINAMAYNPRAGLVDLYGGRLDAEKGLIRCVGDADARFDEDYLRILRAYRFAAVLGFSLDPQTRAAAISGRHNLRDIAPERITAELVKLLTTNNFPAIRQFFDDCADALFPEIARLRGVVQNNIYHCFDVYDHTMAVLQATPPNFIMRMAALFHDTGKFIARKCDDDGIWHFHGHEKYSAEICEAALRNLRLDNFTIDRTTAIVRQHSHQLGDGAAWARKFLNRFGADLAISIMEFKIADSMGKSDIAKNEGMKREQAILAELREILAAGEPFTIKDLAISGKDIMSILNMKPGKEVGQILDKLMQHVLENPADNTVERLTELALRRI